MVLAGCVSVDGTHLSRTCTSGSVIICLMDCMHAQTGPWFMLFSEQAGDNCSCTDQVTCSTA